MTAIDLEALFDRLNDGVAAAVPTPTTAATTAPLGPSHAVPELAPPVTEAPVTAVPDDAAPATGVDWVSGESGPAAPAPTAGGDAPAPSPPPRRGRRKASDDASSTPAPTSGPRIGTLYIDAAPDGERVVYAYDLVAEAHAAILAGGAGDYRTVDYGKGRGLLAAEVRRRLESTAAVVLWTRNDAEASCVDVLLGAADRVVRGLR